MTKNTKNFIGIDVSKLYFDVTLMSVTNHKKQTTQSEHFSNDTEGINNYEKWLKTHKVSFGNNTLVVIENTGVYHRLIWAFCSTKKIPIYIGNATHIKRSFGIARGKNDKIDSVRLCQYACKNHDELQISPTLNSTLLQLKDLMTARTQLLEQYNTNKIYLNELKNTNDKKNQSTLEDAYKMTIKGIQASIKKIEMLI